ncbi:MAG: tetratricopeptide repeat protein, partial [Bacteriovoracaceae bacterium]
KNLSDQHEKLKDENISSSNFNQVDELAEKESASSAETVDVFAKDGLADQASASAPVPPKNLNQDEISQELEYFRKAAALKANGKVDEALKIFQYLERSSTEQVRVRAREHIGDIYMQKGQYDLALQVFEKMIRHDAFSGIVLTALERAVEASEKLNLEQKKAKYQSILKDFFEIEG